MNHKSIHRDTAMASYDTWKEPGPPGWLGFRDLASHSFRRKNFMCSYEQPGWPGYLDLGNRDENFPYEHCTLGNRDETFYTK